MQARRRRLDALQQPDDIHRSRRGPARLLRARGRRRRQPQRFGALRVRRQTADGPAVHDHWERSKAALPRRRRGRHRRQVEQPEQRPHLRHEPHGRRPGDDRDHLQRELVLDHPADHLRRGRPGTRERLRHAAGPGRDCAEHHDDRLAHQPERVRRREADAQLHRERALVIHGLPNFRLRRLSALAGVVLLLGLAAGAWAYFASTGTGHAAASVGTLAAPTGVLASASGASVSLSWTGVSAPTGGSVDGYYVQRFAGSTATPACGSSPTHLLSALSTSCTDTGNPAGSGVPAGAYTYKVTTMWRSWSAVSGASGSVTVSAPTVTSTSPSAGDQGASNFNVTISGTQFESGATASFSGTGITVNSTTFVSATQLTANIAIAAGASTGTRDVTVINPDSGSATATGVFTVNAGPAVSSASPSSGGQGASNFNVTITG